MVHISPHLLFHDHFFHFFFTISFPTSTKSTKPPATLKMSMSKTHPLVRNNAVVTPQRKVRRITPMLIPGTPDDIDLANACRDFKNSCNGNDFIEMDGVMGTGKQPMPAYMTMHDRLYTPITATFTPIKDEKKKRPNLAWRTAMQQIRNLKVTNQKLYEENKRITGNFNDVVKNLKRARNDYTFEAEELEDALAEIQELKKKIDQLEKTVDLTGEDDDEISADVTFIAFKRTRTESL